MTEPIFENIAIIGVGLLGASLAQAARTYGAAETIVLYDSDEAVRDRLTEMQIGIVATNERDAVNDADCVFLCVPVGAYHSVGESVIPHMKSGATLTDVGSVKTSAIDALLGVMRDDIHLVPGHPIAGTEQSGPDAGFASLFQDAWHILTPMEDTSADYTYAVAQLTLFWQQLGSKVETMDAARHDRVLAITSHLPHLIAFNIVATAFDMETVEDGEVVKYSAGGFRDFTRIAASDPVMWRDVFLGNRDAVLETLGRFSEDLAALQRAIRWGDGDALIKEFTRARSIRKAIIDAGQDSGTVNFGRNESASEPEE